MSIRKTIELDVAPYKKSLSEMNRATIRYARKHERLHKENKQALQAITKELNRLIRARANANDPRVVRRYTDTIEKLERQQRQLRAETDKYERSVKQAGDETQSSFKKIGRSAKLWIAGAASAAMAGLVALLQKGQKWAKNIEETASKYETVLGPAIDKTNDFLEENSTLMGLSNTQGKEMVATTTAIAQGFGFDTQAAAEFSTEVVKLAGDLQSFNDVPIERTHNAITSALSGEREALKSLGIVIRETDVQEQALANTGKEAAEALTQQEKATATLQLITERAGKAIGDLERTENSAANRSRQVWAEIRNIGEALSKNLLPAIDSSLNMLEPFVDTVKDWVEVPISEELEQERVQLNSLVMQITSANTSQERRNELITRLQKDYPSFLKNLDAEKATNKELADRLDEVNKKYADRIIVQKQAEEVAEAIEERDRAMVDVADERIALNEELSRVMQEQGLDLDLSGLTELQRLNRVREELRKTAEFAEPEEPFMDPKPLNESAKALQELQNEGLGLTNALAEQREAEKEVTDVEERRKQVLKALGIEIENVKEAANQDGAGGSGGVAGIGDIEEEFQKFTEFQAYLDRVANIGNFVEEARLQHVVNLTGDIGRQLQQIDIPEIYTDAAIRNTRQYNDELTKLNNLLDSGEISQEEFRQKVEESTDKYLSALQDLYKEVRKFYKEAGKKMPKALEEVFKGLFENYEKAEDAAKDTTNTLEDLADTASAILNVADAFGAIDDNTRQALRGIVDVLNAANKLDGLGSNASFLDKLIPGIGMAAGVGSLLTGIFGSQGDDQARQEAIELRNSIEELRRAVEDNTEAFLEQGTIGGDISQEDIDKAGTLIDKLTEPYTGGPRGGRGTNRTGRLYATTRSEALSIFSQLEETFPELYEGIEEQFRTYLEQGFSTDEAIKLIMGDYGQVLETVKEQTGEYGQSIAGAAEIFSDQIKFGGKTIEEAFDMAAEHILNNVATMEELDQKAINLIEEAKALDLSTEEGQQRLREIVEILFNSPQWRGNLTKDEWENMLDLWLNAADQAESATGSEASEWSRSVQAARTITDVQANEMVFLLEMIEQWTRDTAAALGSETAITVNETGIPSFNIPIPLPVEITEPIEPTVVNSVNKAGNDVNNDISIQVTGNGETSMTDQDIDRLTDQIGRALKREIRGRKY